MTGRGQEEGTGRGKGVGERGWFENRVDPRKKGQVRREEKR